jgi:hypothetical protein
VLAGSSLMPPAIESSSIRWPVLRRYASVQDGESYFQGGIAALRIWSRALTNTEVCDLYQSDLVPPDGLVAQYLLDEGSGTVAVDTSGGNNNATIYGATWMTM